MSQINQACEIGISQQQDGWLGAGKPAAKAASSPAPLLA